MIGRPAAEPRLGLAAADAAADPINARDDTDVCLARVDGQWRLYGPDGEIDVEGFSLYGESTWYARLPQRPSPPRPVRADVAGIVTPAASSCARPPRVVTVLC
ncbi:hypothetical protein [Nonomuraea sp. NPDC049400]|uniref:hypothetical protein n=1 Tax=Nonomuraea sp. NPDC049400 TaxID=3364352 RepID=UPI0037B830A4